MSVDSPGRIVVDQLYGLDETTSKQEAREDVGNNMILQCAQETLSRGTSLYEESVYEASVSDSSISEQNVSRRHKNETSGRHVHKAMSTPIVLRDEDVELSRSQEVRMSDVGPRDWSKARAHTSRTKLKYGVEQPAIFHGEPSTRVETPLNLPTQLQRSFGILQSHLQSQKVSRGTESASRYVKGLVHSFSLLRTAMLPKHAPPFV